MDVCLYVNDNPFHTFGVWTPLYCTRGDNVTHFIFLPYLGDAHCRMLNSY